MYSVADKKLRVPKTDLKKKPSFELLKMIGDCSSQDITPHPFSKLKPPKGPKIEDIFIKGGKKKNIKDTSKIKSKKKKSN